MDTASLLEQFRRHLLVSLGAVSLVGCGSSSAEGGSEEGGVTTNPSGDASASAADESSAGGSSSADAGESSGSESSGSESGPEPETGPESESGEDESDDSGPKLDMAFPDMAQLDECTVSEASAQALIDHPECSIVLDDGFCESTLYWGCASPAPGQSCADLCPEGDCLVDWTNCAGEIVEFVDGLVGLCGPYEIDGQCCTLAEFEEFCGTDGRPFCVDGHPRRALLGAVEREPSEAPPEHDPRWRWAEQARAEHASVASFAQFTLRLLALGAPAAFVREAIAAARDEVHHASFARVRASELAERELGFGALDIRGAAEDQSLEHSVLACVREGCIGETLAALELRQAARVCEDRRLGDALERIADDELRHASLAWRFVQWALEQAPELRPSVARVFETLGRAASASEPRPLPLAQLRELHIRGCLSAHERQRLFDVAVDELLRPCAAALLTS